VGSSEFFLGFALDTKTAKATDERVSYESADLTTHGVIVGMTGSGKTGLGIVLLEEAILAGIPTLIVDPKGDMGNLLLAFPDFSPTDFEPWVDPDEARRQGVTTRALAEQTAATWKEGVAGWDPKLEKIRALRERGSFAIYTPGSSAGIPINIVGSLQAPKLSWDTQAEALNEEIEGFVSGLLALAGIDTDPLSSREHVLLSNLIEHAWRDGKDLDLALLIGQIQSPPLRKLGVFDLDSFFPEKDRTALAMRLNSLVASPSFQAWTAGPPLDIQSMLWADGRPQTAIVSLAHLSEEERQFIVTLLFSKVVTWMRGLSGSSDLKLLCYMDEVFGFIPPTATPPAKKPILTMLKQGRAYGVGLVLATQNPVDLDYKAMSNAGTWMVGRLQTERDKARILEGLQSVGGGTDIKTLDQGISSLDKRQFVLHSTHQKEPKLFSTRWAMSYLPGPLSREQIASLTQNDPRRAVGPAPVAAAGPASAPAPAADETAVAPKVASGIPVYVLHPAAAWGKQVGADAAGKRLQAAVCARVHLTFDDVKAGIDHREEWEAVFSPLGERFDPSSAQAVDYDARDFQPQIPDGMNFVLPAAPIDRAAYWKSAEAGLKQHLARQQQIEVFRNLKLKLFSRPGESQEEFATRCDQAAQAKADEEAAKLKDRLTERLDRMQTQLAQADRRRQELEVDTSTRKRDSILSGAGDVLGMLLGGRRSVRGMARVLTRGSITTRTKQRLETAEAKVQDRVDDIAELEASLAEEIAEINDRWQAAADEIDSVTVRVEKTDITVDEVALVWVPTA